MLDVQRHGGGVEVRTVDGEDRHGRIQADHVVLTMHARDVLPLLDSPTERETEALGRFVRRRARVVVHGDARVAGHECAALGAFNYVIPAGELPRVRPTITFFPARLAGLPASMPEVFVTMNPHLEPSRDAVVAERFFLHPVFSASQAAAAAGVDGLQGQRRTWYAGAWLRSPFVHESALQSGMRAADRLARATCRRRRTFAAIAARA